MMAPQKRKFPARSRWAMAGFAYSIFDSSSQAEIQVPDGMEKKTLENPFHPMTRTPSIPEKSTTGSTVHTVTTRAERAASSLEADRPSVGLRRRHGYRPVRAYREGNSGAPHALTQAARRRSEMADNHLSAASGRKAGSSCRRSSRSQRETMNVPARRCRYENAWSDRVAERIDSPCRHKSSRR